MSSTLDEISREFLRTEITTAWVHDRASKRHLHLFSVAEMCPAEQEKSSPIETFDKSGRHLPWIRKSLSNDQTVYVARLFLDHPKPALGLFRAAKGLWRLPAPLAEVEFDTSTLTEEPPGEVPLLLASGEGADRFSAALPSRSQSLRVCSRLAARPTVAESLSVDVLQQAADVVREHIGVDLIRFAEHLGAVHLCFGDPFVRRLDEELSADDTCLLVTLLERDGKTAVGCKLELTDLRPAGIGFSVSVPIDRTRLIIPIPCSPQNLRTRLFDGSGNCIHQSTAGFIKSISIDLGLMGPNRVVVDRSERGAGQRHLISTVSYDRSSRLEPLDDAMARVRRAQRDRELALLEKDFSFLYFEGGDASRTRALEVLRTLLQKARDRCVICDVYLSGTDAAELMPFVATKHLPVRLLGSAFFLRKQSAQNPEMTEGQVLQKVLDNLRGVDASLVVTCRLLRGHVPRAHDRFLVIDDQVYLLGSSLNEFGSRATTLFLAPDGKKIIQELETWWTNGEHSRSLGEFLATRPAGTPDDI